VSVSTGTGADHRHPVGARTEDKTRDEDEQESREARAPLDDITNGVSIIGPDFQVQKHHRAQGEEVVFIFISEVLIPHFNSAVVEICKEIADDLCTQGKHDVDDEKDNEEEDEEDEEEGEEVNEQDGGNNRKVTTVSIT
jgi:hypothetical protein